MKTDKLLHFLFGALIAFACINIHVYYGFMAAIIISIGKEVIYDKLMALFDFLKGKDGKNGKDAAPCIPCKDGLL